MFEFFSKLFGKKREFTDEDFNNFYELESAEIEKLLGKMHDMVGHAIIPFCVGGTTDMYMFPNAIPGTAFVTMELIQPDGSGPKPNKFGTYELLAFTRKPVSSSTADSTSNVSDQPFEKIERRLCGIFTVTGRYASEAKLNPRETMEIPSETSENGACVIFDEWDNHNTRFKINGKQHGLLLVIEIFRQEMEYAMENSSAELLDKLKSKGYYPYSDLDREPVV